MTPCLRRRLMATTKAVHELIQTRMDARRPITPALSANAVALPDISQTKRCTARLVRYRYYRRKRRCTSERVGASEGPRYRDLALTHALGNRRNFRVIDATPSVVENDIDGRPFLDGLKAILRNIPTSVISLSTMKDITERACSARSPTDRATAVTWPSAGARDGRLGQLPVRIIQLRLNLRDRVLTPPISESSASLALCCEAWPR
jgi:hypothetical protein